MKENCVTFYFIKLNAKVSAISSGKEGYFCSSKEGPFCSEVRYLLSKLIFTQFVSCWSRSHEIGKKTREYHQKLNVRVVTRITERFKTYDLRKWGHFKPVYLSFHWLNDFWSCDFELVTPGFKLVTRGFEFVTRRFERVTR